MNWPYIAGFFDGEGHLFPLMQNRRTPVLEMSQSQNRGLRLFEEMKAFLDSEGIPSTVQPIKTRKTSLGKLPMFKLRVGNGQDAKKFLIKVMPNLRIKKAEAQDILRFIKMYPALNNGWYIRKANNEVQKHDSFGRFTNHGSDITGYQPGDEFKRTKK